MLGMQVHVVSYFIPYMHYRSSCVAHGLLESALSIWQVTAVQCASDSPSATA